MTNKRTTKQQLVASIVLLFMCFSMLLGTTFAWFTDSATSAGNKIVAGTLDVQLLMYNGTEYVNIGDSKAPIFGEGSLAQNNNAETLWEPGKTQVAYLAIKNNGNLDLKYQVAINVRDTDAEQDLYKALRYAVKANVQQNSVTEWTDEGSKGVIVGNNIDTTDVFLGKGETHYFALSVHMIEEAGNEFQGGSVDFDVKVLATQVASEKDSFNNQYDKGAGYYPNSSAPEEVPDDTTETLVLISDKGAKVIIPAAIVSDKEQVSLNHTDVVADVANKTVTIEGMELLDQDGNVIDLSANTTPFDVVLPAQNAIPADASVLVYHDGEYVGIGKVNADGTISYKATHFCEILVKSAQGALVIVDGKAYDSVTDAIADAENGATIEMMTGTNTTESPITEPIVVDKEITLVPNGMYLVSEAPATFTVAEGGKLTVAEGSFTIKNTSTNGACVLVDGGEFVMAGGSFDGYTAVRTTEGKSSTVTLAAGWSNRVTVGFDLKGDDTLNVTGGSLYTSKEAVKTAADTHVDINISGGLLSSASTQYSAAVQLNGTATVNMTGGTIAATYQSGLNGSAAIEANVAPTTINVSGTAKLEAKGWGVTLGSHWSSPAVTSDKFTLNVSGDSVINVTGDTGFGIRYCQDGCDVTVSGNAKVSAKFHAIQFNSNSYVYTNSSLTIADNATITSTAGRYGGGYGIAAYGDVTITGGNIYGSTTGVAALGGNLVIDNSVSGDAITINGGTSLDAGSGTSLTIAGTPNIVGYEIPEFTDNVEDLSSALKNGGDVYLTGNVTLNGQVDMNGGSLNGNGATITVAGTAASNYNIDDCVISTTGGTISNLNVIGNPNNTRVLGSGSTGDVVLESNLTIDYVAINKVQYAINGSGKTGKETVTVSNSTLYGWISFSNIKNFTFKKCTLGMGDSYDGYMVVYGNTTFTDCNFEGVFDLGARSENGEVVGAGSAVTFSNCYYDGVKVTAENFVELFFYGPGDERDFGNLMRSYTIKVDGKTVDNSAYVNN